jgi:dienelactone hydrolase
MKSKLRRRLLGLIATLLLVVVCLIVGSRIYNRRDFTAHFQRNKGRVAEFKMPPIQRDAGSALFGLTLVNNHGLQVTGAVRVPSTGGGPYPALLLLGGLRTGRHVLDYVGELQGTILIALDYPYEGNKGDMGVGEFLANLPAMRRAVMNTVPAAMLAVDYLFSRPDVDTDRITLIGGSVGALFAPAIAASDERIGAVGLIFGAGDVSSLIAANVDLPSPLPTLASWIGGTLLSPLEPLKYIDRISPRPLLLLNGTDDPRMPERCSRLLHENAGEPKTIQWIPSGHIHIRDKEFHIKVRKLLEDWLMENRLIPLQAAGIHDEPQDE